MNVKNSSPIIILMILLLLLGLGAVKQAHPTSSTIDTKEFYERFKRSVVSIKVKGGQGTGFFVRNNYIVTNSHVIHDSEEVLVGSEFSDSAVGQVIYNDKLFDIAIIHVPDMIGQPIAFGSSDESEVGEQIIVIGNPYGLDFTLSTGVIAHKNRVVDYPPIHGLMQINVNTSPGISGSPVINSKGQVIGVVFLRLAIDGHYGFAVPSDMISRFIDNAIFADEEFFLKREQKQ